MWGTALRMEERIRNVITRIFARVRYVYPLREEECRRGPCAVWALVHWQWVSLWVLVTYPNQVYTVWVFFNPISIPLQTRCGLTDLMYYHLHEVLRVTCGLIECVARAREI